MLKISINSNLVILAAVCAIVLSSISVLAQSDKYIADIEQWHKKRIDRLKQPDGWLSLAGLFWLKEGENSFGSDAGNDIRFPQSAPAFIGALILDDGVVTVSVNKNISVMHNDDQVTELTLKTDKSGDPTILKNGALLWYIIDRDGKMGVRLKDAASENISSFHGIDMFPVTLDWRVKAKLDTANLPKTIKIPSVLGTTAFEPCPGALVFEVGGDEFRLYPIGNLGDDSYFIIFADETNGHESYGAGRFLSIDGVDAGGETFIDFNKAYNPPCAFTPYATCPLPPRKNRLLLSVTAGEKAYAGGHE